jgi:hypothetical protein
MGKLTRDDNYQGPEPGEVVTEHVAAANEAIGEQHFGPRIIRHLFDYETDQVRPLYKITLEEGAHYLPEWIGPPAEELAECATIEEAEALCQEHYDRLSERTGP